MQLNLRLTAFLIKTGLFVLGISILASLFKSPSELNLSSPVGTIGMGTSTHLRVGIDRLNDAYEHIADMNINWVREEIPWVQVEQVPGQFSWNYSHQGLYLDFDAMLALADRHGLEVVAVLSTGPAYLPHVYPDQPVDADLLIQHWQTYVQAVVDRYGDQIDYWEIGNEMNNPDEWAKVMFPTTQDAISEPAPFIYSRMLTSASRIIRKSNRHDTVILGGLFNSPQSNCFTNPISFLADIASTGAWEAFDVIALHPYWQNNPPETWMNRGPLVNPSTGVCQMDNQMNTNLLGEIRAVDTFAELQGSKPIWITELGWRSDWLDQMATAKGLSVEQMEANVVLRGLVPLLSEGSIQKVFWNSYSDDLSNPGYALTRNGLQTIHNIARLLANSRPLGQFQTYSDLGSPQELGLFEYRFRKEGRTLLFTWAAIGGDQPYPILLTNLPGSTYRAYSADTTDLSLESGLEINLDSNNSKTILVSETPAILIEEKPGVFSSLKYRVEDGLSSWKENLRSDFQSWLHDRLEALSQRLLEWMEDRVFKILNWGLEKISGD